MEWSYVRDPRGLDYFNNASESLGAATEIGGGLDAKGNQVEDITKYLRQEFRTEEIYTHIDTDTKDVWLKLDWGTDEKGMLIPTGRSFRGTGMERRRSSCLMGMRRAFCMRGKSLV